MSIPKEPRQLMINLMYLVLTALLALNVSAEIFNAFKLVDDGINRSSRVLDDANSQKPDRIAKLAEKAPDLYGQYVERAAQARILSKEFVEYVGGIKTYLVEGSGGWDEKYDQPKGYKDKDITTRYLVGKDPGANAGEGGNLERKISEYAAKFLDLVDEADKANFVGNIALRVDSTYTRSDKKNWAHYNFFQMPVLSVMPILSKIENDAKSTEAAVLNYLLDKTGGEDIVFDKFILVSSPSKSYVIAGETYETEISLSAAAKNPEGVSISINGSPAQLKDGVVKYSVKTGETGVKAYNVKATITNPVTKEVTIVDRKFEFEVGRRSASIQLDKMNVFYIGVVNPISVSAAGVSSNELKVTGSGAGISLSQNGPGKYNVEVKQPGDATITLSGGGLSASSFTYRVKPIPTPVAKLGRLAGGSMSVGEFKVMPGLIPTLENFEFDARCTIEGFRVVRQPRRDDPRIANNNGGGFGAEAQRLINEAAPGDSFFFTDVKGKCPGDAVSRALNTLVFQIR
jgi:gliding motility-associated protein GldM